VGGTIWNREKPVTAPLRKRLLAQRESRRWVETAEAARPVLANAAMVTFVADREGDIYPTWARAPADGFHVLNRVMSNRCLVGAARGESLYTVAAGFALAETRVISLPARPPRRAARDARVEIRFGEVEIARPVNEKDRTLAASVRLRLVEVKEIDPPLGAEAVHWRLLTTHAVADLAEAWRIVDWYRTRWTIEQLFRTMKSQGFGLEDSQMQTADGLMKLAAPAFAGAGSATKAACIDMQLVQERDGAHGLPAATVFSDAEIETIEALNPTLEGKTVRQQNPHGKRTLARAGWVIARLGAWNCYGHPPGPITFHRGMERFNAIHLGRLLGSKVS
jgi:Transposase DDE domain